MPKIPIFLFFTLSLTACDFLWTEPPPEGEDLESPFENLTPEQLAAFALGDEHFERVFTPEDGLGPLFNEPSCETCHPGDGRGTPDQAVIRFSRGTDLIYAEGGPQLQTRAIPGATPQTLPEGVDISVRLPPPVFGMGLIEAIPAETILALADPDDEDGDGILGRPNMVPAPDWVPDYMVGGGPGLHLGRFGKKASVASLHHQVVQAYHQDMGITSPYLPEENHVPAASVGPISPTSGPEISASIVHETVAYVRLLAPPARGPETAETRKGEILFSEIGCATCHVPTLRTGPNQIEALNEVDVHLYSDLLLHDLGEDLADGRPDGDATGREWRTAPLWGTRLAAEFNGGRAYYLYDGRANSIEEAIEYHGGEAAQVRQRFRDLDRKDQQALLKFVESL